jgi:hypothetical protein
MAAAKITSGNGTFKRGGSKRHKRLGLQSTLGEFDDSLRHDSQHRSLDAKKQPINQTDTCSHHIEQTEAQHEQRTGHHKQNARNQTTTNTVQIPADVSGNLLRLRPRQQHAQVESPDKPALFHPFAFINHKRVHHGDLGSGPPKGEDANLRKRAREFTQSRLELIPTHDFGGQLCVSFAARAAQAYSPSYTMKAERNMP